MIHFCLLVSYIDHDEKRCYPCHFSQFCRSLCSCAKWRYVCCGSFFLCFYSTKSLKHHLSQPHVSKTFDITLMKSYRCIKRSKKNDSIECRKEISGASLSTIPCKPRRLHWWWYWLRPSQNQWLFPNGLPSRSRIKVSVNSVCVCACFDCLHLLS